MIRTIPKAKVEYGDFQTPIELAERVCQKLIELGVNPDVIIEPTCGVGNFIEASSRLFRSTDKILGVEINAQYVEEIKTRQQLDRDKRIEIIEADFFQFDWQSQIDKLNGELLIIGNFPWVTNSQQGIIGGQNLPIKNNFQNHIGLDAITGKSNFDISEWMLIQSIEWLQNNGGYLAMLCKTSVARKILNHLHTKNLNLAYCASYSIDAKKYFNASVESCLLFCKFDGTSTNYFCDVFDSFESIECQRIYLAPKTWEYLESHIKYLNNRRSKIYLKNPKFSIFGVGSYTFAPWKIAICGLYKKLEFRLIGQLNDKSVIFDDTVYFIGFDDRESANLVFDLLTSTPAKDFYSSLIFWDEKRPVKSSILNSLNLAARSDHYRSI